MTAAAASGVLATPQGFGQVVLVTGHMTDGPGRSAVRFPESVVPAVAARIERTLRSWDFGDGDLLVSGGARGADLLAAAAAESLGATVWLLLAEHPDVFARHSVSGGAAHWIDDFRLLAARAPTWVLDEVAAGDGPDAVYVAANDWMLSVATVQANGRPVRLLAVWDGLAAPAAGGSGDMVDAARRAGADVTIIDPVG